MQRPAVAEPETAKRPGITGGRSALLELPAKSESDSGHNSGFKCDELWPILFPKSVPTL